MISALQTIDYRDSTRYQNTNGEPTKVSSVAVIGTPNAGKSTLVNRIIGTKVSIVSHKTQTTRTNVRGITRIGQVQLVFIDTPGIFVPKSRLERAMVQAAWDGIAEADEIVLLVDARVGVTKEVISITTDLQSRKRYAILTLNKIDMIQRPYLLELTSTMNACGVFTETFMISARTGSGIIDLVNLLARRAKAGLWLFSDSELSDMPYHILAAEITREKIFMQLHQELPYSTTVLTDSLKECSDGSIRIDQAIIVLRENQKIIVLGKGGDRIKSIRLAAKQELEKIFGCYVHLFIHVKVNKYWPETYSYYRELSLGFDV